MKQTNQQVVSALARKCSIMCLILLLSLFSTMVAQAQNRVTGIVRDAQGRTVEGATVTIKGTETSVVTDNQGQYSILVPGPNSILVFSNVGFGTIEEVVGSRNSISPTLTTSSTDLDVVVIGYYVQRKRDVTGAISSINSKTIEEKQPVSIFDAIQGAAPGVRVMSTSGAPGEEADITIRGMSTLSDAGVRPLYVVDGVPMNNINAINPKDIQSIEILKDAASAAIYGSRSANGVILITTKRGGEGKAQIDVGYLRSYNWLSNRISQANRQERVIFDRRGNLGLDEKRDDSTAFSRNSAGYTW